MENTSIKLAIIDIDGMVYQSVKETLEESIVIFKDKMLNLFEETKATHYVAFGSLGKYFRHDIYPEYKGNRKGKPLPKYYKVLKAWATAEYNIQTMDKVEADDLCAYWMKQDLCIAHDDGKIEPREVFEETIRYCKEEGIELFTFESIEKILCSPDKDLLQSIPGKHFNYSFKLTDGAKEALKLNPDYVTTDEDVIKGWWVENTDLLEIDKFFWTQMLLGDTADNIIGCGEKQLKVYKSGAKKGQEYYAREGVKPKEVDEILQTPIDLAVFEEYITRFGLSKGVFNFARTFRALKMLDTDEDFLREVGATPDFPEIMEVSNDNKITEEF